MQELHIHPARHVLEERASRSAMEIAGLARVRIPQFDLRSRRTGGLCSIENREDLPPYDEMENSEWIVTNGAVGLARAITSRR